MHFHRLALVPHIAGTWAQLVTSWRSQLADWLNPYRPERHYMRGPGPKCREGTFNGQMTSNVR